MDASPASPKQRVNLNAVGAQVVRGDKSRRPANTARKAKNRLGEESWTTHPPGLHWAYNSSSGNIASWLDPEVMLWCHFGRSWHIPWGASWWAPRPSLLYWEFRLET